MGLFDWLTGKVPRPQPEDTDVETIRRITSELGEIEVEKARYIACFAYILGRVAHADLDISDDETRAMEGLVAERAGLPEEQAVLVVSMAKQFNELFGATDNFLVTREFNTIATREQKKGLLDCLYAVSATDESITAAEDHEIRRISGELMLSHGDFIEARQRYAEHLELLKE